MSSLFRTVGMQVNLRAVTFPSPGFDPSRGRGSYNSVESAHLPQPGPYGMQYGYQPQPHMEYSNGGVAATAYYNDRRWEGHSPLPTSYVQSGSPVAYDQYQHPQGYPYAYTQEQLSPVFHSSQQPQVFGNIPYQQKPPLDAGNGYYRNDYSPGESHQSPPQLTTQDVMTRSYNAAKAGTPTTTFASPNAPEQISPNSNHANYFLQLAVGDANNEADSPQQAYDAESAAQYNADDQYDYNQYPEETQIPDETEGAVQEPIEQFDYLDVHWHVHITEEGHTYYLDPITGHSQWEDPRTNGITPDYTPDDQTELTADAAHYSSPDKSEANYGSGGWVKNDDDTIKLAVTTSPPKGPPSPRGLLHRGNSSGIGRQPSADSPEANMTRPKTSPHSNYLRPRTVPASADKLQLDDIDLDSSSSPDKRDKEIVRNKNDIAASRTEKFFKGGPRKKYEVDESEESYDLDLGSELLTFQPTVNKDKKKKKKKRVASKDSSRLLPVPNQIPSDVSDTDDDITNARVRRIQVIDVVSNKLESPVAGTINTPSKGTMTTPGKECSSLDVSLDASVDENPEFRILPEGFEFRIRTPMKSGTTDASLRNSSHSNNNTSSNPNSINKEKAITIDDILIGESIHKGSNWMENTSTYSKERTSNSAEWKSSSKRTDGDLGSTLDDMKQSDISKRLFPNDESEQPSHRREEQKNATSKESSDEVKDIPINTPLVHNRVFDTSSVGTYGNGGNSIDRNNNTNNNDVVGTKVSDRINSIETSNSQKSKFSTPLKSVSNEGKEKQQQEDVRLEDNSKAVIQERIVESPSIEKYVKLLNNGESVRSVRRQMEDAGEPKEVILHMLRAADELKLAQPEEKNDSQSKENSSDNLPTKAVSKQKPADAGVVAIDKKLLEPLKTDAAIGKYARMAAVGVPPSNISWRMQVDGVRAEDQARLMKALGGEPAASVTTPSPASSTKLAPLVTGDKAVVKASEAEAGVADISRSTSKSMLKLHWNPLPADKVSKSVWAEELQGSGGDGHESDLDDLANVFGKAASPVNKYKVKKALGQDGLRTDKDNNENIIRIRPLVVDAKKAHNVGISISQFKSISNMDDLCVSICSLRTTDSLLTLDKLEVFASVLPSPQEIKQLLQLVSDHEIINHPTELFYLSIAPYYPALPKRLDSLISSLHFTPNCKDTLSKVNTLIDACNQVRGKIVVVETNVVT